MPTKKQVVIKTCRNCSHYNLCRHRERLRRAFEDFPFCEDPQHLDDEYLISMEFSDIEYAIAICCDEFAIETREHIHLIEEPHHTFNATLIEVTVKNRTEY